MDRRQRVFGGGDRDHHRRMSTWRRVLSPRNSCTALICAVLRLVRDRSRNPARRAKLRLRLHEPRNARHAGRRHRQPGHAVGARRRGAVEPQGRRPPANRAPTATATRPTSMKGVAARYPAFSPARGRPINLEQRINLCRDRPADSDAARLREQGPAGAHRLCGTAIARHADRDRGRRADQAVPRRRPRDVQPAPGAAQSLLRAVPRRQLGPASSPARRYRRATPPAIRSTGWNGRRSARCSGGCATACSGCAPRPIALGAPEYVDLELYLVWRARGMPVETPAVRP